MTRQLTVTSSPEADAAGGVAQVVASLPVSLHPFDGGATAGHDGAATGATAPDGGAAALVAIAGIAGWPEEALGALAAGARGVVVVSPSAADVTALQERAKALGVPVVLDTEWAPNPAVAAAAPHFAAHDDEESLVEARVDAPVGSDLDQVLLAQLALVRAAVGPVVSLSPARWNKHGYDVLAQLASGARASLGAILTDAAPPQATVRIIKPHTAVALVLPGAGTAAPGKVTVSGPDGATLLPTQWETAHRALWRRLHALVEAGQSCEDLLDFAADASLLPALS